MSCPTALLLLLLLLLRRLPLPPPLPLPLPPLLPPPPSTPTARLPLLPPLKLLSANDLCCGRVTRLHRRCRAIEIAPCAHSMSRPACNTLRLCPAIGRKGKAALLTAVAAGLYHIA